MQNFLEALIQMAIMLTGIQWVYSIYDYIHADCTICTFVSGQCEQDEEKTNWVHKSCLKIGLTAKEKNSLILWSLHYIFA